MTDSLVIKNESEPLDILNGWDLTEEEASEFDYIKDIAEASGRFARYRGEVYDLHDCEPVFETLGGKGWHGCYGTSYWSATLFRYVADGENVVFVEDSEKVVFAEAVW